MKKLIEKTIQHFGSSPYLDLPHYAEAGKVGQFNLSSDSFTELSANEVSKTKIARGYYAVLDGVTRLVTAIPAKK